MWIIGPYLACDGCLCCHRIPELREALAHKLAAENGLQDADVMVTAGANQVLGRPS